MARDGGPVDRAAVERMAAAVPHRATGGTRVLEAPGVALVQLHRRAPDDAVPHRDERGRDDDGLLVVADARIDNDAELRRGIGSTAPPREAGAAALIAAAYRRWGLDLLPRLVGDFAIALWDPGVRRLLLARDPLAMRALYHRIEPSRVLLATEAAQLLAVPGVPDAPDEAMAAAYLVGSFGPLDRSYLAGIDQVAPGHALVVEDGRVRIWRHWDVDPGREVRHARLGDYAEHLRATSR
jgi:asparagine synthase (glutamine-hydrolysing)